MKKIYSTIEKVLIIIIFFSFVFTEGKMLAQIPTDDFILNYPFNGSSNDEGPNEIDGTVIGASLTNDRFDNSMSAYSFDGIDDYIDVPFHPALYPNSISISLWINISSYPTTGNRGYVLSNAGSGGNPPYDPYHIYIDDYGFLTARFTGDNDNSFVYLEAPESLNTNTWYHIVSIFDHQNDIAYLYLDNVQVDNQNSTLTLDENDLGMHIGADQYNNGGPSNDRFYCGLVDDIRMYDIVLNESEIDKLYNEQGNQEFILYYPFNGNSNDEGPNEIDGTVIGASLTNDRFGISMSAYIFDGIDDYIDVPFHPALYPNSISISLWINISSYPTTGNRGYVLSNAGSGGNPPYDPYWKNRST